MKASQIVLSTLGKQVVPLIHDVRQLHGIYMSCSSDPEHEQWTQEWPEVKGVHRGIAPICEPIQQAVEQRNQDPIAVSFVKVDREDTTLNLNKLEPIFMYTQILIEILLDMDYNHQSIKNFVLARRNSSSYIDNKFQLNVIGEFERDYTSQSSVIWYTRASFVHVKLNRALRLMEADTIIDMGFFIRDLHQQIQQLHQQQVGDRCGQPFIVYRGQGLSTTDFNKLLDTKGGLMSFNSFLSTSRDEKVSHAFADSASEQVDMVGILFKMYIDPSISSVPFASIREISYYETEEEVLFSMHTVFRIVAVTKIDSNSSVYQVDLKLTADDDQQLRILTEHIRAEVAGETGWKRLGLLLLKIGQFDKAEQLYKIVFEQTADEDEKALNYNNLGHIKHHQGDYEKAIEYYKKGLEISETSLHPNHLLLATFYGNIGLVYRSTGEYWKALSFCEKAHEIYLKTLPANHPWLAASYHNIGSVYGNMGEYPKALSFYEKAHEIFEKTLPPNHSHLAISHQNIGLAHNNMGEYEKALSFCDKAHEIYLETLPPNHPSLAASYNNIGLVYNNMGEYSKALSFYEKAHEIFEQILPPNHPSLATTYNNIGLAYNSMEEYSKAFSFCEKTLQNFEKILSPNHPHLAISYHNIALMYNDMGEYSKALWFYKRAGKIFEKALPPNHSHLAISHQNIGLAHNNMGEYEKALSFYEKAHDIHLKTLPPNHPSLAASYKNIGLVYKTMGEYSKSLSFYEKALEIHQKTLPIDHPDLAVAYNNIDTLYYNMKDYSKALLDFQRAQNIS